MVRDRIRRAILRVAFPVALPLLLEACAGPTESMTDAMTCLGSPAVVDWRYSDYERARFRQALRSRKAIVSLNNCWDPEVTAQQRIAACSRAISSGGLSEKDRSIALDCRGNCRALEGDYAGAVNDYSEALSLDPYSSEVYSDRAAVRIVRSEIDKALLDLDRAIQLQPKFIDPRYATLFTNRAAAWLEKGEFDRAIADATTAIGKARYAPSYANRAFAWLGKGDVERAIADLDSAIQVDPRSKVYRTMREDVHSKKGEQEAR